MAKKLLNEATVRRFQSLANLKPINEMAGMMQAGKDEEEEKMEEGVYEAEEEKENLEETYTEADEEPEAAPEVPEMDDAPEMEGGADLDDVELTDEEAEALIALGEKLAAAMGDADEPEMEMDDAPEAPMMEEDDLMETLSEIDYVPSQAEIVNEVARRVARRLAEAQKAEKRMNEALGRK